VIDVVPSLRCYPKDDDEFAADLTAAIRSVGLSVDAVRDALRQKYPSLRIAARAALASEPDEGPVWYCYRDGSLIGRSDGAGAMRARSPFEQTLSDSLDQLDRATRALRTAESLSSSP
jgi:hypothetical protein